MILATFLGLPLRPFIEPTNLVMLYLLTVVIAAIRLGRRPAVLASFLSVVAFNLFFVPPYYTYEIANAEYLFTFAALLIVGVVISTLAAQSREQLRAARRRETQTTALYDLSQDLATSIDVESITRIVTTHIEQMFESQTAVLLPDTEGLKPGLAQPDTLSLHGSTTRRPPPSPVPCARRSRVRG